MSIDSVPSRRSGLRPKTVVKYFDPSADAQPLERQQSPASISSDVNEIESDSEEDTDMADLRKEVKECVEMGVIDEDEEKAAEEEDDVVIIEERPVNSKRKTLKTSSVQNVEMTPIGTTPAPVKNVANKDKGKAPVQTQLAFMPIGRGDRFISPMPNASSAKKIKATKASEARVVKVGKENVDKNKTKTMPSDAGKDVKEPEEIKHLFTAKALDPEDPNVVKKTQAKPIISAKRKENVAYRPLAPGHQVDAPFSYPPGITAVDLPEPVGLPVDMPEIDRRGRLLKNSTGELFLQLVQNGTANYVHRVHQ